MTTDIYTSYSYDSNKVHRAGAQNYSSPEWKSWSNLIYKHSTEVCERWKDFKLFYVDLGDKPTNKHSLARRDKSELHSKTNSFWYPGGQKSYDSMIRKTQPTRPKQKKQHSPSRAKRYTHEGQTKTLREWSLELDIHYDALKERVGRLGMSFPEAINYTGRCHKLVCDGREFKSGLELSKHLGVSESRVYRLARRGKGGDEIKGALSQLNMAKPDPTNKVYVSIVDKEDDLYIKVGITCNFGQRQKEHANNLRRIEAKFKPVQCFHMYDEQDARTFERICMQSYKRVDLGVVGFMTECYEFTPHSLVEIGINATIASTLLHPWEIEEN